MLKLSIKGFTVHMNYLHKAKNRQTYNYRRIVPADLKQHYSAREIIKSLKTGDETIALRKCAQVNRQVEAEFERLRSGLPKDQASSLHLDGMKLLRKFGIHPEHLDLSNRTLDMDGPLEEFNNHLESIFSKKLTAQEFDEMMWDHTGNAPFDRLPPEEKAAIELLRGEFFLKASQYPQEYIRLKGKEGDKKFKENTELGIKFLLATLPDKPPGKYKRHDLNELITHHLAAGLSTGSIQRRLATLRTVFNLVSVELELDEDKNHPFHSWTIPNFGEDKIERKDFSFQELQILKQAPSSKVPEVHWLILLMMETGLRINECCGLQKSDLKLEDQYPHLVIQRNPFRPLKTKQSQRVVPLVGAALVATKKAFATTKGEWLFERYINSEEKRTKNTSASNAVNKRLRSLLGDDSPTCHSFRHTIQTRLREVNCPEQIRNELGGWTKTLSQTYGSTSDLKNKTDYLTQTTSIRYRTTRD